MKYFFGIDGGGTKSNCAVMSADNSIVFQTTGASTNFLVLGTEKACINILDIINECCNQLGISYKDIDRILIGTAGAGRKEDAEKLKVAFEEHCGNSKIIFNSFRVESDARIALEGAFSGGPGCILIAGTGSIIFGKDTNGNIFRSGGYGRIIGDEGGGYSMGKKALQALSKYYDGRGLPTVIEKLLKTKHNISSPEDLIKLVHRSEFNIASVALSVIQAAGEGDEIANKIIDEESEELVLLISSMIKKLNLKNLNLCLLGSLIDNDNFYSLTLREKISGISDEIELRKPEHPPEIGAILLAQKL